MTEKKMTEEKDQNKNSYGSPSQHKPSRDITHIRKESFSQPDESNQPTPPPPYEFPDTSAPLPDIICGSGTLYSHIHRNPCPYPQPIDPSTLSHRNQLIRSIYGFRFMNRTKRFSFRRYFPAVLGWIGSPDSLTSSCKVARGWASDSRTSLSLSLSSSFDFMPRLL